MALSQISNSREIFPTIVAQKEAQKVKWLGRTVHEANSVSKTDRWIMIVGIIVFVAGLALAPFAPIEACAQIASMGLTAGGWGIYKLFLSNHLEKALIHLIGSKEKLNRLTEVKRTTTYIYQKQGNGFNLLDRNEVLWIEPEAMTSNVMRVTEKGKTIGVAFKYLECLPDGSENTEIRVYFFNPPAKNPLMKIKNLNGNYISKNQMYASEAKALEGMIKHQRFIQERPMISDS